MLDSYVDVTEDEAEGAHSYIGHYSDQQSATERITEVLSRSLREVANLPNAHRHAVIVVCMVAMYLSKDSARTTATQVNTNRIMHVNGNLGRALVPVLRAWRILYKQQST
jgi:hypothetical protein